MNKERILIVEDDAQIRNFVVYALKQEEFDCITAENGNNAISELLSQKIDIVILDLGLPDIDGMDVIDKIREWSDIPIIVVSARDQDSEKADALDRGADDYLAKPFSLTEHMARIRVAVRHLHKNKSFNVQSMTSVGELTLNIEKRLLYKNGEEIHLTPLEYSLMSLLFRNIGKVLTSQYILNEIYGANYGNNTQSLRALMAGLRRKIEETPGKLRYILTEIGVGYRLVDE